MAIPNPFNPREQGEMNMKRNAYDLSRTNLFTSHWGRVTPCFLQEVIPGDSFKLDNLSLAVQGMPTVFPLQTRVRVSVEFYYGRNRCVFDGFEDFIFKTKDVEQPWLRLTDDRAKEMISTGSLGDMFGIPTTKGSSNLVSDIHPDVIGNVAVRGPRSYMYLLPSLENIMSNLPTLYPHILGSSFSNGSFISIATHFPKDFDLTLDSRLSIPLFNNVTAPASLTNIFAFMFVNDSEYISEQVNFSIGSGLDKCVQVSSFSQSFVDFYNSHKDYPIHFARSLFVSSGSPTGYYLAYETTSNSFLYIGAVSSDSAVVDWSRATMSNMLSNLVVDSTDDSVIASNPFIGGTPDIKINALPFRHYEQICNYYYRNDKNNPYYLNGEVQYNEFIPTHAAGADDNVYSYHYKNWELDRFTSALQSPQFGEAPLVGLTFTGDKTATLEFEQDGHTYTAEVGVDSNDVVETIQNFSQDIPSANLRKLQEMINYGISINDLRVTNSFQRFLENVMRRGLRYRNQLKSHFGIGVDYPDIDIPQYIGGFSGDLTVGKTTSMAQTSEASLGDFNGQLSGMLQAKHSIHCYCPEHGFIIGMVTITPVPVYTQTCNKVMIKQDPFDYYLPEFGKIGFVPMHYSEVMPLQTPANGSVDDVFGYQKAHYDYMQAYDEAHSFFRTNLKDFVLQRTFAQRPTLVEDFTVINPEQLSDVFITQNIADKYNVSDKFLCNFYAHVVAKRPIPRVGTPSLE